jgi:hypothetical protein
MTKAPIQKKTYRQKTRGVIKYCIEMKIQPLLFILLLYSSAIVSQPVAEFSSKSHDFGVIKEADGPRNFSFNVSNKGNQPLVIQNVVPSCGCTSPEWTKTPVPPNGEGKITAIFDPSGRSGVFNKTLTVYSNAKPNVVVLTIKGEVVPRVRGVEELYTWPVGQVRFEGKEIMFSTVLKTQKKIRVMPAINSSKETVKVEFADVPGYLSIKMAPATLNPGQKGLVECTYYGTKDNRWGNTRDMVKVKLNGVVQETGFFISAFLAEDFSNLSKGELENGPVMEIETTRADLGEMEQSAEKIAEFRIRNNGKRDLIIRDIKPACDCITLIQGAGLTIKPGDTGILRFRFNSGTLSAGITKPVYVYSNDPKNSQSILLIHADIKQPRQQKK